MLQSAQVCRIKGNKEEKVGYEGTIKEGLVRQNHLCTYRRSHPGGEPPSPTPPPRPRPGPLGAGNEEWDARGGGKLFQMAPRELR